MIPIEPARTPDGWLVSSIGVFTDAVATFSCFRASANPRLRVAGGDRSWPRYDRDLTAIRLRIPAETGAGASWWASFAACSGLTTVEEARLRLHAILPFLIVRCVASHLRVEAGAPSRHLDDHHAASVIALAMLRDHPEYGSVIDRVREHAAAIRSALSVRLDGLELAALTAMKVGADGPVETPEESGLSPLADATGEARVLAMQVYEHVRDMLWIDAHLGHERVLALPKALGRHLFSESWPATRRAESRELLTSGLYHLSDDVARTCAAALRVDGTPGALTAIVTATTHFAGNDVRVHALAEPPPAPEPEPEPTPEPSASASAAVTAAESSASATGDAPTKSVAAEAVEPTPATVAEDIADEQRQIAIDAAARLALQRGIAELSASDAGARSRALYALCDLAIPASDVDSFATIVASLLAYDGTDAVRLAAARCLERHPSWVAVEAVVNALDDPYPPVRTLATALVNEMGPQVLPLLRSQRSARPETRLELIQMRRSLGDVAALTDAYELLGELVASIVILGEAETRPAETELESIVARAADEYLARRARAAVALARSLDEADTRLQVTIKAARDCLESGRRGRLPRRPFVTDPLLGLLGAELDLLRDETSKPGLTRLERIAVLDTFGPLHGSPIDVLMRLASVSTLIHYHVGETVCPGGELDALQIIVSGAVERRPREGGDPELLSSGHLGEIEDGSCPFAPTRCIARGSVVLLAVPWSLVTEQLDERVGTST